MIGHIHAGGLNLTDVRPKIKAIKMTWMQRMCKSDVQFWKQYCKHNFDIECKMIPFCRRSKNVINTIPNDFYKQVLMYK